MKLEFKRKYSFDKNIGVLFIGPSIIILLLLTIYPTIYSIIISLYEFKLGVGQPKFTFLGNYIKIFKDPIFYTSIKNTLAFVVFAVGLEFLFGLVLAILLDRDSKYIKFFRNFLILPMVITPVASALMWLFIYNKDFGILYYIFSLLKIAPAEGFLGNPSLVLGAVIVVDVWQWTPFIMLLILAGLQSIPAELYEAAKIDGASSSKIFLKIVLPYIRTVILISILLRVIEALKIFDTVFILTGGGPGTSSETIALYAYRQTFKYLNFGIGNAMGIIILIITIIISQSIIRFLRRSMEDF